MDGIFKLRFVRLFLVLPGKYWNNTIKASTIAYLHVMHTLPYQITLLTYLHQTNRTRWFFSLKLMVTGWTLNRQPRHSLTCVFWTTKEPCSGKKIDSTEFPVYDLNNFGPIWFQRFARQDLTSHSIRRPQKRDPFRCRNKTHFHLISYFPSFIVWIYNTSSSDLCQTVGKSQRNKE